jgi:hypothetical protein
MDHKNRPKILKRSEFPRDVTFSTPDQQLLGVQRPVKPEPPTIVEYVRSEGPSKRTPRRVKDEDDILGGPRETE